MGRADRGTGEGPSRPKFQSLGPGVGPDCGPALPTQTYRPSPPACTAEGNVKRVRDQAEAIRLYVKKQKMGLEMQNSAAEIKLRAERRAGEMLKSADKHTGGRPKKNPLHAERGFAPTASVLAR